MMPIETSGRGSLQNKVSRIVLTFLDGLMAASFLIMIAVIITGGWQGHIFQVNIGTHRPEQSGMAVIVLLLLRKLIDRHTLVQDFPLIRTIRQVWTRLAPFTEERSRLTLALLITGYVIIMGTITIMKHSVFQSHAYDLGIFSQLLWSAANGFDLHSSILGRHILGEHFSPIFYLFVPGYFLWPYPSYLLLIQTIALGLTTVPLYLLASSEFKSRNWGIFFAFLFLCYRPMRNVNLYDFHEIALATPLLMLAFYWLHQRKNLAFLMTLGAALACREEITEIIFIFGIYAIIVQKRIRFGTVLAVFGLILFFTLLFLVMPYFRNGPYPFVGRYQNLGPDILSIVTTLATRPFFVLSQVITREKLFYLWDVFGPLGFLSLASPSHLLLALPTLVQNLLSGFPPQYSVSFQYTSPLTPFVFISAVFGAKRIFSPQQPLKGAAQKPFRRIESIPVFLLLWFLIFFGESPTWHLREYRATPYSRYIHETVLTRIPPQASVSAQEPFVPHLTQRKKLYMFPVVKDAEYVLLDFRANKWPLDDNEYFKQVSRLLGTPHRIVRSNGTILILQRLSKAGE